MHKILLGFIVVFLFILAGVLYVFHQEKQKQTVVVDTAKVQQKLVHQEIRYMPIGDSYTFGQGATPEESFPALLTDDLQKHQVDFTLVANPAISGYTSQQAIDNELSEFESSDVNFVTVLIGANDIPNQTDAATFHTHLNTILDTVQEKLPNKHHLLLMTIPDFSVTPFVAKNYPTLKFEASVVIQQYNGVIREEAQRRGLQVVDLYAISKDMGNDPTLVSSDGVHPTAKEYAIWEKQIYPVVLQILSQ